MAKDCKKKNSPADCAKTLRSNIIVGYVLWAFNTAVALTTNIYGLVDSVIVIAFLLGIHLRHSKFCAYGLLAYSIINSLYVLGNTGSLGGWWWILIAGSVLSALKKVKKAEAEVEVIDKV